MIRELLRRNRSFRRFDSRIKITAEQLRSWIESARYTASMRNAQPLKYLLVTDQDLCNELCGMVHWAGYLPTWDGPVPEEVPTAFIIQLLDTEIAASGRFDEGLQLAAITLTAVEDGFGACIFQTFSAGDLSRRFELREHLLPLAVVALGRPVEQVRIEEVKPYGSIKYYRDEAGVHHVPKRPLEELIEGVY